MKRFTVVAQVAAHHVGREDIEAAIRDTLGLLIEHLSIEELPDVESELERMLRTRRRSHDQKQPAP